MPNRHETLTSLFTDIADSIRAKTGDTAEIKADDFDTAIDNIPSGGGGEYTVEQLLGVDIIDRVNYTGTTIPNYALAYKKIRDINIPNVQTVNTYSFYVSQLQNVTDTTFENVTKVDTYGFYHCNESYTPTRDIIFYFPKLTTVSSYNSFAYTGNQLSYYSYQTKPGLIIIAPKMTLSATYLLYNVTAKKFIAPKSVATKTVGYYTYANTIDISGWANAGTGGSSSTANFYYCYNLATLILRGDTMSPAPTNPDYLFATGCYMMKGTKNTNYNPNGERGIIYVPDNLVDTYRNDTNWQTCFDVSHIRPLSEYDDPYASYIQGE